MWTETRPHEAGFGSNRVSEERGEYVPAPCTHRPSKHPSEVRMRPHYCGRIWASQGGLSRNKVAVGESAAGSPPTDRDLPTSGRLTVHTHGSPTLTFVSAIPLGPAVRSGTFELPRLTSRDSEISRSWAHSSAAECLLCKEDAVGSNPTESIVAHPRTVPLIRVTAYGCNTQKPMHRPA